MSKAAAPDNKATAADGKQAQPQAKQQKFGVCFVCLGNICRSPLGEGIFKDYVAKKGMAAQFTVSSCGTGDWHVGEPADDRSTACAAKHSVDISKQRARHLSAIDYTDNDFLVCMDSSNFQTVKSRAPKAGHRARIVKCLDYHSSKAGGDVPDPYYGNAADFEHVYQLIDASCEKLLAAVLATAKPTAAATSAAAGSAAAAAASTS